MAGESLNTPVAMDNSFQQRAGIQLSADPKLKNMLINMNEMEKSQELNPLKEKEPSEDEWQMKFFFNFICCGRDSLHCMHVFWMMLLAKAIVAFGIFYGINSYYGFHLITSPILLILGFYIVLVSITLIGICFRSSRVIIPFNFISKISYACWCVVRFFSIGILIFYGILSLCTTKPYNYYEDVMDELDSHRSTQFYQDVLALMLANFIMSYVFEKFWQLAVITSTKYLAYLKSPFGKTVHPIVEVTHLVETPETVKAPIETHNFVDPLPESDGTEVIKMAEILSLQVVNEEPPVVEEPQAVISSV